MQNDTVRAETPDDRRVRAERLLARYPDISDEERGQMLRWLRKEASIYDIAMLAGDPRLEAAYTRVKHEHLDRLSLGEKIGAVLLAIVVLGAIAVYALA